MITHEDGSVTLTEAEWLNVRPRWINMEDAHPNNGEVVLCYLLSKHGHKEYRRLSWCDHYGNWGFAYRYSLCVLCFFAIKPFLLTFLSPIALHFFQEQNFIAITICSGVHSQVY